MKQTCPHCDSDLSPSVVGNLCLNCGYVDRVRHYYQNDDHDQAAAPHASTDNSDVNDLFEQPNEQPDVRDQFETSTHHPAQTPERPKIINHHASSHYRKRLEQLEHQLDEPAIESAIEPDSSLEAPLASESVSTHQSVVTPNTVEHPVLDVVEAIEQDIEAEDHSHQPSPYVLDPTGSSQSSQPRETPVHHADAGPRDTPPSSAHDALKRADVLLASAQTTAVKEPRTKFNYAIIGVTAIMMIGLSSFLAWSLLGPSLTQGPKSNPSPTQSTSPKTSVAPSVDAEVMLRDKQRKQDLSAIATALAAYQKTTGSYPVGNDITALSVLTTSTPAYIATINNDPLSKPDQNLIIKYNYTSDGKQFTLTASLENKQDADAANGLYIVKN